MTVKEKLPFFLYLVHSESAHDPRYTHKHHAAPDPLTGHALCGQLLDGEGPFGRWTGKGILDCKNCLKVIEKIKKRGRFIPHMQGW